METIKIEEKACCNCIHLLGWGGDFSFGLRCKHPENQKEESLPIIPSPKHCCKYFENKHYEE